MKVEFIKVCFGISDAIDSCMNGANKMKKVINGYEVNTETPDELVTLLEKLYDGRNTRITIDYGDTKTGKSWNEVYDITGYIGRSTGNPKLFLLVKNKRSSGGGAILTDCILSIRHSNKKNGGYIYKLKGTK